LARRVGLEPT